MTEHTLRDYTEWANERIRHGLQNGRCAEYVEITNIMINQMKVGDIIDVPGFTFKVTSVEQFWNERHKEMLLFGE